jgi:hypothetical protein
MQHAVPACLGGVSIPDVTSDCRLSAYIPPRFAFIVHFMNRQSTKLTAAFLQSMRVTA